MKINIPTHLEWNNIILRIVLGGSLTSSLLWWMALVSVVWVWGRRSLTCDMSWHLMTCHTPLSTGETRYFVIKTKTQTGPEKKRSRVRIKGIILSSCKQSRQKIIFTCESCFIKQQECPLSGWLGFWCFKMRNIRAGLRIACLWVSSDPGYSDGGWY